MSTPNYPLPRLDEDPRFTYGLHFDLAKVLVEHGFPELSGADYVDLGQAMLRFLYASEDRPVPQTDAAQLSMLQRCEIHVGLDDDLLGDLAARAVYTAVTS